MRMSTFELKNSLIYPASWLRAGKDKISALAAHYPCACSFCLLWLPAALARASISLTVFPQAWELQREQRQLKARLSQLRRELQRKISGETGKLFNPVGRMRINKLDPLCKELENRKDLVVAAEGYAEMEFIVRDTDAMRELAAAIDELEEKIQAEEHKVRVSLSREVGRQHACCWLPAAA